jgi:hypothetical protein
LVLADIAETEFIELLVVGELMQSVHHVVMAALKSEIIPVASRSQSFNELARSPSPVCEQ